MNLKRTAKLTCIAVLVAVMTYLGSATMLAQTSTGVSGRAPRIVQKVDESRLISLTGSVHPLAVSKADRGAVSDDFPMQRMLMVLRPSEAQQIELQKMLDDQQNPQSAGFHKWLSPADFGVRFGVAPQDALQIINWLSEKGFSVEPFPAGGNVITFSGTHGQFRSAFRAEIHSYLINGKLQNANSADPQIPEAFAPVIAGIVSLNNFYPTALHVEGGAFALGRNNSTWKKVALPDAQAASTKPLLDVPDSGGEYYVLGPYDFATMYNVKPLWDAGLDGTGQTIAIVSDSDINPADVDSFRSSFGLPAKKLNIIYVGPNPGKNKDEGEADLDVQWSGGVARNATIDLVVAANTGITSGVDLAAQYIVANNLAPVMSISYGACEYLMGNAANAFHEALYQQAAAQGITVLVASGDEMSAQCDPLVTPPVARNGFATSGYASTPYNVAVGGTDLSGNFGHISKYWGTQNDPTTLQTLLSYVPETPWNASCGNSVFLSILPTLIADKYVGPGVTTAEGLCNDPTAQAVLGVDNVTGGGGGPSNCSTFDGTVYPAGCTGRRKPSWQSQVLGAPNDNQRDLPDVSLFAGSGLWGSFYAYCQSDVLATGICNPITSIEGAGGTSFASPALAGIIAILNQKTQSQQGNANYVFYKIGASEYSDSNQLSACAAGVVAVGNSCVFYDVTQGSNAPACASGTPGCVPQVRTDAYAVLPGWYAGPGYDMASGLGTVNAYNLVTNWNTYAGSLSASQVSLTLPATAAYGSPTAAAISVNPVAGGSGLPTGDVSLLYDSGSATGAGAVSAFTLSNGIATAVVSSLSAGSHQLFAHYGGDAMFAGSTSAPKAITITQAITLNNLVPSRPSVLYGESLSLTSTIQTSSSGVSPTGTVVFMNMTTGATLGTVPVSGMADPVTNASIASAFLNVPGSSFTAGSNVIVANYSGDSNYLSSRSSVTSVSYSGAFTVAINPGSLVVTPATLSTTTAVVTVSPNGGFVLSAPAVNFACQVPVAGITCSFGSPTVSGSTLTSALSIQLSSPLLAGASSRDEPLRNHVVVFSAGFLLFGVALLGVKPKRRLRLLALVGMFATSLSYLGCSSGGSNNAATEALSTVTTLSASSPSPGWSSPVTLQAQVSQSPNTAIPSGTVTFMDGNKPIGTVNLSNGSATLVTSSLPLGVHSVTAQYSGSPSDFASSSSAASIDVNLTTTAAVVITDHNGNTSTAQLPLSIQ